MCFIDLLGNLVLMITRRQLEVFFEDDVNLNSHAQYNWS